MEKRATFTVKCRIDRVSRVTAIRPRFVFCHPKLSRDHTCVTEREREEKTLEGKGEERKGKRLKKKERENAWKRANGEGGGGGMEWRGAISSGRSVRGGMTPARVRPFWKAIHLICVTSCHPYFVADKTLKPAALQPRANMVFHFASNFLSEDFHSSPTPFIPVIGQIYNFI